MDPTQFRRPRNPFQQPRNLFRRTRNMFQQTIPFYPCIAGYYNPRNSIQALGGRLVFKFEGRYDPTVKEIFKVLGNTMTTEELSGHIIVRRIPCNSCNHPVSRCAECNFCSRCDLVIKKTSADALESAGICKDVCGIIEDLLMSDLPRNYCPACNDFNAAKRPLTEIERIGSGLIARYGYSLEQGNPRHFEKARRWILDLI